MSKAPVQGVIFDLDGVLVHTDELHFRAWAQIAAELDIPFDRTVNARLRGVSRAESLDRLLACKPNLSVSEQEKEALCRRKNELYRTSLMLLKPEDVPDAVRSVLELLRERGIRIAVGSSSRNAGLILQRTGLDAVFDAVADGTMISASKPDPDVFLRAAELLHLEPCRCAVVEDAPAGILAAHRAGMLAIGLGAYAAAEDAKPDILLTRLDDLTHYL